MQDERYEIQSGLHTWTDPFNVVLTVQDGRTLVAHGEHTDHVFGIFVLDTGLADYYSMFLQRADAVLDPVFRRVGAIVLCDGYEASDQAA